MFFGWGENAVEFPMPDGRTAVCAYKYFSLLFIFRLARSQRWYIVEGPKRASLTEGAFGEGQVTPAGQPPPPSHEQPVPAGPIEVQRGDLDQLFAPEGAPSLGLWQRFGIIIPVIGFLALLGIGAWSARGTTTVLDLESGDCFVDEGESEVDRLSTPLCTEPHDSQVTTVFDAVSAPEDYPAITDAYWDSVFERCLTEAEPVLTRVEELPDDAQISFLSPTEASWDQGDRTVLCFLWSPGGLDGSFVAAGGS